MTSTDFSAQQQQDNKGKQKKAAPAARPGPQRAAPQRAAPQRSAPREAAPRKTAPRTVTPQRMAPSTVTRQKPEPRVVRQPKTLQSGRSGRRRSIARCRSARRCTTRHPNRHCSALARGPGAARAALSSAAKITRRGAVDTAYVTAAAGGRSSPSAP